MEGLDATTIEMLAAVFLPLLIAVIKKAHWPTVVNALIAVVVYVVAGLLAVFLEGLAFDINNIVPTVAVFVAGGTVAYQLFWKNWGDPQIVANVLP